MNDDDNVSDTNNRDESTMTTKDTSINEDETGSSDESSEEEEDSKDASINDDETGISDESSEEEEDESDTDGTTQPAKMIMMLRNRPPTRVAVAV